MSTASDIGLERLDATIQRQREYVKTCRSPERQAGAAANLVTLLRWRAVVTKAALRSYQIG